MKLNVIFVLLILFLGCKNNSFIEAVTVSERQILVNNSPYTIKGICYNPVQQGSVERSFEVLDKDLALMVEAGINTIRVYMPIEEVEVLDKIEKAGLKIVISFGYNQNGYYDILSGSYIDYVEKFKFHNAILFWELGNEYNYHAEWFENDIKNWYNALNNAADAIHLADKNHPVSTAHGDVNDIDLALSMSPNIDVWGLNVYRGDNPTSIFLEWETISGKPIYLSEAGADSYMTVANKGFKAGENQAAQAKANAKIIDATLNASNLVSGLFVFSFSDEWWKASNPNEQDKGGRAPMSTGVPYDGTPNEEYWGIVDINRNKKETFFVLKKKFK